MENEKPDILDFDFTFGGFFSSGVLIQARKGVIRMFFTNFQVLIDNLFDEEDEFRRSLKFEDQIEEVNPSESEWEVFLKSFSMTDSWKRSYDSDVEDGVQWELKVYYDLPEGKVRLKKVSGSNNFPPDFKDFGESLGKLIHFKHLKNSDKFKFWEQ